MIHDSCMSLPLTPRALQASHLDQFDSLLLTTMSALGLLVLLGATYVLTPWLMRRPRLRRWIVWFRRRIAACREPPPPSPGSSAAVTPAADPPAGTSERCKCVKRQGAATPLTPGSGRGPQGPVEPPEVRVTREVQALLKWACLVLMFLTYPSLSTEIVKSFRCVQGWRSVIRGLCQ